MASIPRTSPDARLIAAAADLLARQAGAVIDPTSAAAALHAAGMLQSPETAAELTELRARLEGIRSQASDAAAAWIDWVDGRPIAQAAPPAADLAATSALDSLIDEYGRADTAPLGDMRELRMKLEAIRREATAATEARVAELETQRERRRIRLIALDNDAQEIRGILSPNGEARKVPMPLGETLAPAVEWLVNRVAELEAQAATTRADALTEAAGIVNDTVHLFPDTSEYAAAKGALEGLAIRLRRLAAAPSPQPGTPECAAGADKLLALADSVDDEPVTVYRASLAYEAIPLGWYTTREAARACCQAEARDAGDYADGPVEWDDDGDGDEVWWPFPGATGYQVAAITAEPAFQGDAEAGDVR